MRISGGFCRRYCQLACLCWAPARSGSRFRGIAAGESPSLVKSPAPTAATTFAALAKRAARNAAGSLRWSSFSYPRRHHERLAIFPREQPVRRVVPAEVFLLRIEAEPPAEREAGACEGNGIVGQVLRHLLHRGVCIAVIAENLTALWL